MCSHSSFRLDMNEHDISNVTLGALFGGRRQEAAAIILSGDVTPHQSLSSVMCEEGRNFSRKKKKMVRKRRATKEVREEKAKYGQE